MQNKVLVDLRRVVFRMQNEPLPLPLATRRWTGAACLLGAHCLAALATRLLPVGADIRPFERTMASLGGVILLFIGIQAMRVRADEGRATAVVGAIVLTLFGAMQVAFVFYAPAEGLGGHVGINGFRASIDSPSLERLGWEFAAAVTLGFAVVAWWRLLTSSVFRVASR